MRTTLLVSVLAAGALIATIAACSPAQQASAASKKQVKGETLVVGGGCFWCIEPLFEMVKGVEDVEVGYAGGARPNPTYEQVCTGVTGHAEAVKVWFDPEKISRHDLMTLFFTLHDPTTKNRQGPDSGPQYRSVVFYETPEQKALTEKVIGEIEKAKIWNNRIVTTVEPLVNYTTAEDYHQDYYKKYESASASQKMSMNAGYCNAIIEPKVRKFRDKYKHLLKF